MSNPVVNKASKAGRLMVKKRNVVARNLEAQIANDQGDAAPAAAAAEDDGVYAPPVVDDALVVVVPTPVADPAPVGSTPHRPSALYDESSPQPVAQVTAAVAPAASRKRSVSVVQRENRDRLVATQALRTVSTITQDCTATTVGAMQQKYWNNIKALEQQMLVDEGKVTSFIQARKGLFLDLRVIHVYPSTFTTIIDDTAQTFVVFLAADDTGVAIIAGRAEMQVPRWGQRLILPMANEKTMYFHSALFPERMALHLPEGNLSWVVVNEDEDEAAMESAVSKLQFQVYGYCRRSPRPERPFDRCDIISTSVDLMSMNGVERSFNAMCHIRCFFGSTTMPEAAWDRPIFSAMVICELVDGSSFLLSCEKSTYELIREYEGKWVVLWGLQFLPVHTMGYRWPHYISHEIVLRAPDFSKRAREITSTESEFAGAAFEASMAMKGVLSAEQCVGDGDVNLDFANLSTRHTNETPAYIETFFRTAATTSLTKEQRAAEEYQYWFPIHVIDNAWEYLGRYIQTPFPKKGEVAATPAPTAAAVPAVIAPRLSAVALPRGVGRPSAAATASAPPTRTNDKELLLFHCGSTLLAIRVIDFPFPKNG